MNAGAFDDTQPAMMSAVSRTPGWVARWACALVSRVGRTAVPAEVFGTRVDDDVDAGDGQRLLSASEQARACPLVDRRADGAVDDSQALSVLQTQLAERRKVGQASVSES